MSKVINIEKILNILDIKYSETEEDDKDISKYMCSAKIDDEIDFPFLTIINHKHRFLLIGTLAIMKIPKQQKIDFLEIINSFNANLVYGTFYIEDEKLYYNVGISLESGEEKVDSYIIGDYVEYMKITISELLQDLEKKKMAEA